MSKHCVHLNLNINPVTIDYSNLKKSYHTKIQFENLNPELIATLHNRGVIANYAESFYSPPNFFQPIHTDNLGGDYVKINFVYGGHGSQMHWYKVKETSSTPPVVAKTLINTDYIPWKADMVDLVESDPLNYPSIVQAGCPHNVVNTNDYRLCISVILSNNNLKRASMDFATTNLADLII